MSLNHVKEALPISGTGTDAVMTAIRKLLGRGDVITLKIKASEAVVHYERYATQEEAEVKNSLTYHDVIRARTMEEYLPSNKNTTAYQQMFEMFEIMDDAGFSPILILSGRPLPQLREWLGLMSRKAKTIFGVRVLVEESIPEDNLILCGSDGADEGPESVQYSVKVTLP